LAVLGFGLLLSQNKNTAKHEHIIGFYTVATADTANGNVLVMSTVVLTPAVVLTFE